MRECGLPYRNTVARGRELWMCVRGEVYFATVVGAGKFKIRVWQRLFWLAGVTSLTVSSQDGRGRARKLPGISSYKDIGPTGGAPHS